MNSNSQSEHTNSKNIPSLESNSNPVLAASDSQLDLVNSNIELGQAIGVNGPCKPMIPNMMPKFIIDFYYFSCHNMI
jgi:hypothetical protein